MNDFTEQYRNILDIVDCDGDRLMVAAPWPNEDELMMRIVNEDTTTAIVITLPIALALMGVLLPLIQSGRFDEKVKEYMDPDVTL
jgi:hypothetical protein